MPFWEVPSFWEADFSSTADVLDTRRNVSFATQQSFEYVAPADHVSSEIKTLVGIHPARYGIVNDSYDPGKTSEPATGGRLVRFPAPRGRSDHSLCGAPRT